MLKTGHSGARLALLLNLLVLLSACSPALDWREIRSADGSYTVLMPAKPASDMQKVVLAGKTVDMTMRGAEVNRVTYAVGSVQLASEDEARQAASEMQQALLRNIAARDPKSRTIAVDGLPLTEVQAGGKSPSGPVSLAARFGSRGTRVYQAVVLGPSADFRQEAAETFLESFHPGRS